MKFFLLFTLFTAIGCYYFIFLQRFLISQRGKVNRCLVIMSLSLIVSLLFLGSTGKKEIDVGRKSNEKIAMEEKESEERIWYIKLGVPLLNQLDEPVLYYGCEVTSLAMLLNYYGIEVSKNELADELPKEPYQYSDGTYGDPNIGFVGDMYLGKSDGFGVYVKPILKLAETKLPGYLEVKNLTNVALDQIIDELSQGNPVWVMTTLSLKATDDMVSRKTKNGEVQVSKSVHSVVLTGFDQNDYLFVNDPYGKEKKISRKNFQESWEQMGCQALAIQRKKKEGESYD